MADQEEGPKLQIDSDWKAEVEAEKSKLAEKEAAAVESPADPAGGPEQLPPADFRTLLSTLVTPALLYLGGMPDPQTGQAVVSLELARHYIDLLAVLEEKSKNNLSEEEASELATIIYDLRTRYVEISKHVASMPPEALQSMDPAAGGQTPPSGGIQAP